jgi:hypothetical protein
VSHGYSIHIGLNHVDATSPDYQGVFVPELFGCLRDADRMEELARAQGCGTVRTLRDGQATANHVLEAIAATARSMDAGDLLILTYSGHGSRIPDETRASDGCQDSTWVLYDRMLAGKELGAMWPRFAPGTRIAMVSDSCHSGTVDREVYLQAMRSLRATPGQVKPVELRTLDPASAEDAARLFARNHPELQRVPPTRQIEVGASVLLLAACQDDQTAADGRDNGLFTQKLLEAWGPIDRGGTFQGNYPGFCDTIKDAMPSYQIPNLDSTGARAPSFESERPFNV